MATLAMMAGGAILNSIAFSSSNFIFGQLGDHGKAEMQRHNLAMEQLSKAREKYSRDRQQRLDLVSRRLSEERHAKQTFSDLNLAMQDYYTVTSHRLPPLREPRLSDFYNPTRSRKDAEIALVVGGMAAAGLLAYKFSK